MWEKALLHHPWTNGHVDGMSRTIKDTTVKRFCYEAHDELRKRHANFVAAYNFAKRLSTLKDLTTVKNICKFWKKGSTLHIKLAPSNLGTT